MQETDTLIVRGEAGKLPPRTLWTVYAMMVLFGLASLLPWNMVITATGYFAAKFQETESETIIQSFPSYFQIGGIGSNVLVSLSSIAMLKYLPIKPVIYISNTIALIMFILMTIMSKQDTTTWPMGFFLFSNISFCIACAFSAAYTSGMMAIASMLTPNAIQGFYLGQGAAGLFATLLSIITLSLPGADPVQSGFYYFLIASISLAFSLVGYVVFNRLSYVKNTTLRSAEATDDREGEGTSKEESVFEVFMKIWKFCATSLVTLMITLACFPAALSALRPISDSGSALHPNSSDIAGTLSSEPESLWRSTYFLPVITFLVFNIGDVLGRITSSLVPYPSPRLILPLSLLRALFIPLIYMCNLQPRALPVWFASDAWPAIFNLLLSWTNGHVLSLSAGYGPQHVESQSGKSLAGTYAAFSSALGLVVGSLMVFPLLDVLRL